MRKKWKVAEKCTEAELAALGEYPDFLKKLLIRRGLKDLKAADRYLNPSYERDLHDPFLMKGMTEAVDRVALAIKTGEKIVIHADYDADGVSGAVILKSFFDEVGYANYDVYIPNRNLENYGLSLAAGKKFAADGAKLVITVDCGITDAAEIAQAKKQGVDVIITDHHLPPAQLPPALAIVDSKQANDPYPFKLLCGAAVAFKLVRALMARVEHEFKPGWEKWLLDLAAIATVADMVPLEGENRTLAHFGLKVLRQSKRPGLDALCREMKLAKRDIAEDDISFMLAPRLNAAGRMSQASQSFFLLTTNSAAEAADIAKHLEDKNKERKALVNGVVSQVEEKLSASGELPAVIVAGDMAWPAGGLGLAANRLKDNYGRPVFLWGGHGSGGEVKGSGRSTGAVNLVSLMGAAGGKDYFNDFGGHFMAAGFSLFINRLPELEARLNQAYSRAVKESVDEEITVDEEIDLNDVNWSNYRLVEQMGPYGIGNRKPVFLIRNVTIAEAKTFGNDGSHLELKFIKEDGRQISAVGFFSCFEGSWLKAGEPIDLLVNMERSIFRRYPELRLRIVNLRPAS